MVTKAMTPAFVLLPALLAPYAANAAVISLYIPGAKPDVISANVLGTDDNGHTTWRLQPGVPSGTFTDADSAAFTATMVAGPTDAHIVRDDPVAGHLQNDCAVSDGLAACTIIVSDANGVMTAFATETVHPFEVQVVTLPPVGTAQTQGGSPRVSTGTAAPAQLTGAGTGTTGNAEPEQTDKPNGTMGLRVGSMLTVTVLGMVGFAFVTLF
ncbi:hypothetical protein C8Q74DRAFT_1373938 [Fomes fomentarius]|nr:hypothetical protein C8Q74DRAFT_1373938 [Fomes fomentarius]